MPLDTAERDLLQRAVDLAVEITDSEIGYIHYVNPDQQSLELCTWSQSTMQYCTAVYDRHYAIEQAGIWADTARLRAAQVHNDYEQAPDKRGLPEGHAPVRRHLGVPAISDGLVRLMLGVGNAGRPYDARDVAAAQQLADSTWSATSRLRDYQALRAAINLTNRTQTILRQVSWQWDPYTGEVLWDPNAGVALPGFDHADQRWTPLLRMLDEHSRRSLQAATQNPANDLTLQLRAGELTLLLQGFWADRPQGRGRIMRGTLLDVSVLTELDRAHDRATHDQMTGLPNRAWLMEELGRRIATAGRRANDQFAVHFLDLDDFKAVNDDFGHLVGDEVLITCAQRLQALTRQGEVVARYGGDEFVLIQNGPIHEAGALALARRMRTGLSRHPIRIGSQTVHIGVSVGVAACLRPTDLGELLGRADAALYRAKRDPDGVVFAG